MGEELEKPITVRRKEFVDELAKLVNSSGLPAFVIADLLERLVTTLHAVADEQYAADLKMYEKEMQGGENADT